MFTLKYNYKKKKHIDSHSILNFVNLFLIKIDVIWFKQEKKLYYILTNRGLYILIVNLYFGILNFDPTIGFS